jgi:hypothetical protein
MHGSGHGHWDVAEARRHEHPGAHAHLRAFRTQLQWSLSCAACACDQARALAKPTAAVVQDETLRLKASLERAQRLTTAFVDGQLAAFAAPARTLGAALGLSDDLQGVFAEAEIRASVAFQLAKLNAVLLHACRSTLGLGEFDGIVLGSAAGILVAVPCIEPGMELAGGQPCVLLVKAASGDEEVRPLPRRACSFCSLFHSLPDLLAHSAVCRF